MRQASERPPWRGGPHIVIDRGHGPAGSKDTGPSCFAARSGVEAALLWRVLGDPASGRSGDSGPVVVIPSPRADSRSNRRCYTLRADCARIIRGRVVACASCSPVMSVAYLRTPHDSAFKRFILNPDFIRHLLRAYPLPDLDEAEVVRVAPGSANIVDPFLKQRLLDALWRLEMRDGSIAFLLIECQATKDPTMAVRFLHSAAAVYLALTENPLTEFGYSATRLPLVRCVVVFSGKFRWDGPLRTLDLMATGNGEAPPDVPRMECLIIDLRHSPDPGKEANVAVMLVRLQACDDPDALSAAAEPLRAWVRQERHVSVHPAMATWISHVLLPGMGVDDALKSDNLEEVLEMLLNEKEKWSDRVRREAKLEGIREGQLKLLLTLVGHRFGPKSVERLATLLETVSDPERIDEITRWIVDCPTDDALFAQLG